MVAAVHPMIRLVPIGPLPQVDDQWERFKLEWDLAQTGLTFISRGLHMGKQTIVPTERIERHIHWIRGQKVMLDVDLAEMYGVPTGHLNRAVRRNIARFPDDFLFQLDDAEARNLMCQTGISSTHGGRRRSRPYAFTEQGVAMLSSVLRSERAVQVNVQIMRTFVRLRQMMSSHAALSRKLDDLEKKYDSKFRMVFDAIRSLMTPAEEPSTKRKPIGYHAEHVDEED